VIERIVRPLNDHVQLAVVDGDVIELVAAAEQLDAPPRLIAIPALEMNAIAYRAVGVDLAVDLDLALVTELESDPLLDGERSRYISTSYDCLLCRLCSPQKTELSIETIHRGIFAEPEMFLTLAL
jgi:hypothetical protein